MFALDSALDKVVGPVQLDPAAWCADIMATTGPGDTALMYCADAASQKGQVFIIQPQSLTVTGRIRTTYRIQGCMGFDQNSGSLMLVGGRDRQGDMFSQLIMVDAKTGQTSVTDLSTAMPPVANGACADLGDGRILIQGGITPQGPSTDTYIVSPDSDTSLLVTLGGPPANARPFATTWAGKVVVFDGASKPKQVLQAWVLDPDAATWSRLFIQPGILGGVDIASTVDQDDGVLYVFVPDGKKLAATTWFASLAQNDLLHFKEHTFSGDMPSSGAGAAYSSKDHKIWFFGGEDTNVYRLGLTDWECRIIPVQGKHPSARNNPLVVFSPSMNGLVVFGGLADGRQLADCWLFQGDNWQRMDHGRRTLGRSYAVWDEAQDRVVVFEEAGNVLLFDARSGLWQDTGASLPGIQLNGAAWDPYSNIAVLLQNDMKQAVSVYVSPDGRINTHITPLTGIFPVLSGSSVFFDPFMRRIGMTGGVDALGQPSAAVLTLGEVCPR